MNLATKAVLLAFNSIISLSERVPLEDFPAVGTSSGINCVFIAPSLQHRCDGAFTFTELQVRESHLARPKLTPPIESIVESVRILNENFH
ncbi:MAG: hypothetical protein KDD70_01820 [Bdellovibrionales bacterium]|nr:hypothetical protein [Bdellovibrionales bacterium]